MFDPDSLTSSRLNDLRAAAEQAWGDDTRHEKFVGHPQPSAGQCFVTSAWMVHRLGGHIGVKHGHYFWVSPDKQYAVDLTGELMAHPPIHEFMDPADVEPHHKTWRPGPVLYKRTDHPIFKGLRIIDPVDHPRAQQFIRKADLALRGERVSSVHIGDLMGPSGFQTPQQGEDYANQSPLPFMLHDEPAWDPSQESHDEYNFVFVNGQLHVSPKHQHGEMFQHAGASPNHKGPTAVGYVTVDQNNAVWEVDSNVSLRGLHKLLEDYTNTVGWEWGGMVGPGGEYLHDDFGPKMSLWYTSRNEHAYLSKRPLPNGQRVDIRGKTAFTKNTGDEGLQEWAKDAGYKLAEYPGGGNMLDKMKTKENLDVYNRGDTDFQPERNNLDQDLGGPLKCGQCNQKFDRLEDLRVHERYDHRDKDYREVEDGHFPHVQDFDEPLGFGSQGVPNTGLISQGSMQKTAVLTVPCHTLYRHPRFATYAKLFGYDQDEGHQFYGAYRGGQLVGYGAVRLTSQLTGDPKLDELLERYRQEFWHGAQAGQVTPEEVEGLCTEYAWELRNFLVQNGIPAEVRYVEHPSELGYTDRARVPDPDEGHAVVQAGRHTIDFSAAQYGYSNFPMIMADGKRIAHAEPEVLMIDAVQPGQGIGSAILGLIQTHFDHFYTHADSKAGERLMERMGMVNTQGFKWRYSASDQPKDMIESAIPFVYEPRGQQQRNGWIHIGYPGQRTHDIEGSFHPGNMVEGYYEPGGKLIIIDSGSNVPYTTRALAETWYHRFPQMEITSVEREMPDGKTHKIASTDVGNYIRSLIPTDQAAHEAYRALRDAGGKVYAVGGAVRDALLQKEPKDIDLMVSGLPGEQVEYALRGLPGQVVLTGKRFGVYRYKVNGQEVEVALPRTDTYEGSGRGKGVINVNHELPIESDLTRRDFTANSMAVDLDTGELIDPHGGARDIENHVLRTTHPDSFREDPTRTIRALTMHGRYGLMPDERTRHELETHGHLLRHESPDALNKVIDKMLGSSNPSGAIRLAQETGTLQHFFPEVAENWDFDQNNLHHSYPLGEHLMQVLDNTAQASTDPDMRLTALYHDVGKPASMWINPVTGKSHYYLGPNGEGANHDDVGARMAENRMRTLNYPVTRINRVRHLIQHHMFPAFNNDRGARRFLNRVGDQHADDLLTLRQADMAGKGQTQEEIAAKTSVDTMRQLVDQARSANAPTALSGLSVNGNDLISMGLTPGPQIGRILQRLLQDTIENPALNERATLLQRAREYVNANPNQTSA